MQSLAMKVPLPAPGRTRNALTVEDVRKVILGARKQACHSIPANSFQGPGRRPQVLQRFATDILINCLHRISVCDESSLSVPLAASAVFFSSPASRLSYESRLRNAP